MDERQEKLLRQYLDRELDDEQEQQVLHMIADDAEMRSMLHFERKLQIFSRDDTAMDSFDVPPGFSDQVMNAIEVEQNQEQPVDVREKIKRVVRSIWKPTQISFRPAYGLVLLLILGAVSVLPVYIGWQTDPGFESKPGASVQQISDDENQVWTRFIFIDNEAESIAIAGDFNNWEPRELNRQNINGEQVWTGLIPMKRGEHRYMFVKDGEEWVTDPLATMQQDDGFGNKNAVIYL